MTRSRRMNHHEINHASAKECQQAVVFGQGIIDAPLGHRTDQRRQLIGLRFRFWHELPPGQSCRLPLWADKDHQDLRGFEVGEIACPRNQQTAPLARRVGGVLLLVLVGGLGRIYLARPLQRRQTTLAWGACRVFGANYRDRARLPMTMRVRKIHRASVRAANALEAIHAA